MLRRWSSHFALAVLFAAGAVAWGYLSIRGTNRWVFNVTRGAWFEDVREIPSRDVAIVPGTGFHHGRPHPPMEERLRLALNLYEAGLVRAILVSGNEAGPGYEVSGMQRWLIERGVPSAQIMVDPLGTRTLETMTRAVMVFGVRSAIVCTQGWAAPRAVFLARGAGIDAIALVPEAVPRRPNQIFTDEHYKTTLAFLERYVLGRTRTTVAQSAELAMSFPPHAPGLAASHQ